jgi:hypothetical protein
VDPIARHFPQTECGKTRGNYRIVIRRSHILTLEHAKSHRIRDLRDLLAHVPRFRQLQRILHGGPLRGSSGRRHEDEGEDQSNVHAPEGGWVR